MSFPFRYTLAKSNLRRPVIWLRHRGLQPTDVFLASYPRSGNTWLRFVLAEMLAGQMIDFDNINDFIPELKLHRQATPLLPAAGRLIKTHEPYRSEYRRAIYLVRDVRDVALSGYARSTELGLVDPDFELFLISFLRGNGVYGSWHRHVCSWIDSPLMKQGNLLVIKFEDIRRAIEEVLHRIVQFLGVTVEDQKVQAAVTNNSLARMRRKEDSSHKLLKSTHEGGRFIRSGSVGGWKHLLTEAQVRVIEQNAGSELARMGYSVSAVAEEAQS